MAFFRTLLILFVFSLPVSTPAAVVSGDLPNATIWYFHANLEQMRSAVAGRAIYDWLDREVLIEFHEEVGVDVGKEVNSITAFSSTGDNAVILIEGEFSQDTRDKILAAAAMEGRLDTKTHSDTTYYHVQKSERKESSSEDGEKRHRHDRNVAFRNFDDEAWFSFVGEGKIVVTSQETELQTMLDNGGRIAGGGEHDGAIFVLTADKTFFQAGLRTDELDDDEDGWRSNIVRNTEQAALLVSEMNDLLAVQAQLRSHQPEMARSIGGIISGLIGLQALNDDLDAKLRNVLENTTVEVDENILSISTIVDPELIVSVLDD
jgi:hypothetical protein